VLTRIGREMRSVELGATAQMGMAASAIAVVGDRIAAWMEKREADGALVPPRAAAVRAVPDGSTVALRGLVARTHGLSSHDLRAPDWRLRKWNLIAISNLQHTAVNLCFAIQLSPSQQKQTVVVWR
jgi:hypothetical protein